MWPTRRRDKRNAGLNNDQIIAGRSFFREADLESFGPFVCTQSVVRIVETRSRRAAEHFLHDARRAGLGGEERLHHPAAIPPHAAPPSLAAG